MVKTEAVLELLEDVADRIINPRFRSLTNDEIDQKSHPGDLVTVADREAEVEITKALTAAHPDSVVLGEEAYAADPTVLEHFFAADHAFTIDPIDGTLNFVNGSPDHAVMLSEIRTGVVVRSWIWQPQRTTAYVAERGSGVERNGALLPRPAAGDPGALRLHTSKESWHGARLDSVGAFEPTWLCCGVDYPNVASGDADAVVYRGTQMPWDHAPGSLVISEVGGGVRFTDGKAYNPSEARPTRQPVTLVAAASPATFEAVAAGLGNSSLE